MPEGAAGVTERAAAARAAGLEVRLGAEGPIPLDLAFACAPGELLALVGPSGAGKSTALRCVAGLHRAARGTVRVGAAVWFDSAAGTDLPAHRRAAGLVFQDYALFPHMTALGNLVAAMGHRPRRERESRARALLALVHLAGLEERRPAELSGGQQQRVAVARALARDPAVLLLDEPFSAVDRATRRRLQSELAALRRSLSIPILLVTHDLDEALALADRMCLMHRGRGLQTAAPAEMLARPASAEVARLLDLRNLFRGTIERHDAAAGVTFLRWGGRVLEAAYAPAFAAGETVDWMVPPSAIVLHRRGRPSLGERENPVPGRVRDLLAMGEKAEVTLDVGDPEGGTLAFSLPLHAARRNGLAPGEACTVSLLREGIHAMARRASR
ncbi:ABC transporter ATP-binding protein [Caldovatus aquaticus]|uniref:ABC transporter ATP-binding protein n=1 Tax=Caldovatus aquaticus TaxID=2865671 RepID=A0ABS7EZV2_9PROT|nr:ABC transporter ATP-binding protein [Caldovatus aquaticus]MBW8268907.1 ABC transporter ATP-binding protein [Caldovatus aquaticus]